MTQTPDPSKTPNTPSAAHLAAMRRTVAAWWATHSRPERRLLAACAALAGMALVWLLLLHPSLNRLAAARAQLPTLTRDMAQIETIVREAQLLQQGRQARTSDAQVMDALRASARRAGLADTVATTVTQDAPQRWQIAVDGAPAARMIDWLAQLPFLLQVRVASVALERAQMDGRERPGFVSGQIVLTRAAETAP